MYDSWDTIKIQKSIDLGNRRRTSCQRHRKLFQENHSRKSPNIEKVMPIQAMEEHWILKSMSRKETPPAILYSEYTK